MGAFLGALDAEGVRVEVVGDRRRALAGTVFLALPRIDGDRAMLLLDAAGFSVSAGSACDAGLRKSSSVLRAVMGEQRAARGGIRVSFGRGTDETSLRELARVIAAQK